MEIPITFAIVIFLIYLCGAPLDFILGIILMTFGVMFVGMTLFFVGNLITLLGSKKHRALFRRFTTPSERRFECACYLVNYTEYANAFPREVVMSSRLYNPKKPVTVFLSTKKELVFDKNAVLTIIAGTIISSFFSVVFFLSMDYILMMLGLA